MHQVSCAPAQDRIRPVGTELLIAAQIRQLSERLNQAGIEIILLTKLRPDMARLAFIHQLLERRGRADLYKKSINVCRIMRL